MNFRLIILGLVLIIGIAVFFANLEAPPNTPQMGKTVFDSSVLDARNPANATCHWKKAANGAYLQDANCTPGDVFANVTTKEICVSGYSATVRNVSTKLKNQVYAEYGITDRKAGEYEIDHLISLQLGGSNDIKNLFPEPLDPRPGFREKDVVENKLKKMVCDGKMSLTDAQRIISTDWTLYASASDKTQVNETSAGE